MPHIDTGTIASFLRLCAAVILVSGPMVAGYRLHRWVGSMFPKMAARLPTDSGAWLGFAAGVAAAVHCL